MDAQDSSPSTPPVPEQPVTQPVTPSGSKNTVLYVIIGILVMIILVGGGAAAFLLMSRDDEPEETTTKESTIFEEIVPDNNDAPEENQDQPEEPQPEPEEDITSLWDTYDNTVWKFRLKHPKAMDIKENTFSQNIDKITFSAGGTDVFVVWLFPNPDMDTNLANSITNQCTDSIDYGKEMFGTKDFRTGKEVVNTTCLQQTGSQRNVDLAAFGLNHPTGADWVLANHELIQEQLEGVLGSVTFY